jgi:hypothetical protein
MVNNRKYYESTGTDGEQARQMPSMSTLGFMALLPFLFLFLVVGGALWWWYGWRIEPKKQGKTCLSIRLLRPL